MSLYRYFIKMFIMVHICAFFFFFFFFISLIEFGSLADWMIVILLY